MPQYWVIAPYTADRPDVWDKMWALDLEQGFISIGWSDMGNISGHDKDSLRDAVSKAYPEATPGSARHTLSTLWTFRNAIKVGDYVIARKGRKTIAGVGIVTRPYYYDTGKSSQALGPGEVFPNHIDVNWLGSPRNKVFDRIKFGMQTLYGIDDEQYQDLLGPQQAGDDTDNAQTAFVLEKYLQEFIVSNFHRVFGGQLVLHTEEGVVAREYQTDVGRIDILAEEPETNSYVVIELKKGQGSDNVIGQVLRYMGWVKDMLCQKGPRSNVKGIVICQKPDLGLEYALRMVESVSAKYYRVDFKLGDTPFQAPQGITNESEVC